MPMQANTTQPTTTPPANKKWSWKTIGTVLGLTLFFTGAMVAVLIVQRQRAVEGPVAPNAPISEPAASTPAVTTPASCALTFTIAQPTGVSCVNKVAFATALTAAQLSNPNPTDFPNPLSTIAANAEYFYVIAVSASGPTTDDITVIDTLPSGVTFVAAAGTTGVTANAAKTEVTYTFPKFTTAGTKRVQFKVKAGPTASGKLVNTVALKQGTAAAVPAPSCTNAIAVNPPGAPSCTNKLAYATALTAAQLGQANTAGFPTPLTAINANAEYFYVITVSATGPTTDDITVIDTLPSGVTFVAAAGTTGVTANAAKTEVTYTFPKFAAAGTKRAQFKVKAGSTATGTLTNTVALKQGTAAAVPAPSCTNAISVNVPGAVSCTSKKAYTDFFTGVTTTKGEPIAENSMIAAGTEFVYSITVTATGATDKNVIVTDVLPVGITYVGKRTGDPQVQNYTAETRTVGVNLGRFTAGALTKTVEFKVKTAADIAVGAFTNTAKVNLAGGTAATEQSCSLALETPPRGTAVCEYKKALTNFTKKNGTVIPNATIKPGDTVVYQIKINAPEQTTGAVKIVDTLPEGMEFVEDPDNTEGLTVSDNKRIVSLELGILGTAAANKTAIVEFKAKAAADAKTGLVNKAEVTTGTSTTPAKCEQSLAIQAVGGPAPVACNENCKYNSDCKEANHVCATTSDGTLRCRLDTNVGSAECKVAEVVNPVGKVCNEVCSINADCAAGNHICATTAEGTLRCRLDSNPEATDCRAPGIPTPPSTPSTPIVAAPIVPPTQPALPEELPVAGPEDWTNWLKAGLVTLGIGAILLLLL
jgi:fimbrial isopeptide formation D2 family protein/uncharacterized repeat protein (TIGR01451 family)